MGLMKTDRRLTSAQKATSPKALDPAQWVKLHGDVLFGFAVLRVRDREVAEDLVQDCLVGAYEARHRFTGEAAERTWLVGILKHKIIDHLRKRSRQKVVESSADQQVGAEHFDRRGRWLGKTSGWDRDPKTLMENREFQATLTDCIAALPDKLATTFVLREIDGIESEEVCTILGITSTNMWARIHRARLNLRRCLESKWFFDDD
ncbi:MAG: RNA polymerase sigma factor [Phycisphaerae bacterium]|nr:MAG: RNA polymerase sigma factor [Phycisphaerae bacterium]